MELFVDPAIALPKLKVARRLLARKIGFRNLLDVTPIKGTSMVKGSNGLITEEPQDSPIVISNESALLPTDVFPATSFKDLVLAHVFAS